MKTEKVKVIIWGFGAMGSGMARMILAKRGFEIVGVCDNRSDYINKSMYSILNLEQKDNPNCIIKDNINEVIKGKAIDICLLATDSYTDKAYPKIKLLLENKINCISTAEEMIYPYAQQKQLALEMDRLAKENGVTVLGAGINPGMMMDLLVIFLTGAMSDVDGIEVARINSLSPFGKTVMEEQGVGLSIEEFNQKIKEGKLAGHVGFLESTMLIAHALGLEIDEFSQEMTPIITKVNRKSQYGNAKAGDVAGVDMTACGKINNESFINLHHPQQIEPQLEGINTGDFIKIKGTPEINMSITPEVDGGIGTIAVCVNMIPHVINATPGLKLMTDLPVPRAIMGDVRKLIIKETKQ
ncbi:MAG: 2,4-diaminopentanoate dehydrogenase [Bacilli bacterium]|nr:2,4-diaminopentanoate dehydrogenase [Bacilli bacterium]